MTRILIPLLMVLAGPALANGDPLAEHLWQARPLVIFAPSDTDPRLLQQQSMIEAQQAELDERDVIVFYDTTPEANSELREKFHPRGFQVVLIGKDGQVKLRKPFPWDVREISRIIDKMPLRQQEIRSGN